MKGGRKLSRWNLFTRKIFMEGKKKNPKYEFREALVDASKRKGEMKNMGNMSNMRNMSKKHMKKSNKHMKKSNKTYRKHLNFA